MYAALHASIGASGRAWAVSIVIANRQVPGSNPPEDTGNFCDSAHIRPVVAIPETPITGATQKSLLEFRVVYKGRAPPSIVQQGV